MKVREILKETGNLGPADDMSINGPYNMNRIEGPYDISTPNPEQEEDDNGDEEEYCSSCNGTGEGMYDGTRCYACKGSGIAGGPRRREIDPDYERDRRQDAEFD